MNKVEQCQLCMLLAKMRYDIMRSMVESIDNENYVKQCDEILSAINKVMSYSYIDGDKILKGQQV